VAGRRRAPDAARETALPAGVRLDGTDPIAVLGRVPQPRDVRPGEPGVRLGVLHLGARVAPGTAGPADAALTVLR